MEKAVDAYRTISEVGEDLDLPQHVLRFWETRFTQIKPLKRGGGRRYYRPEDVDLLKGIRHLLYGEGFTIRGVQRILKEQGVKAVIQIGRGEGVTPARKPDGPDVVAPTPVTAPRAESPAPAPLAPTPRPAPTEAAILPMVPKPALRLEPAPEPLPVAPAAHAEPTPAEQPQRLFTSVPRPVAPAAPIHHVSTRPMDQVAARPLARPVEDELPESAAAPGLPREAVRLLQATLYELTECRRLLDAALAERAENA